MIWKLDMTEDYAVTMFDRNTNPNESVSSKCYFMFDTHYSSIAYENQTSVSYSLKFEYEGFSVFKVVKKDIPT